MNSSSKESTPVAYPKSLLSIVASVGGLALFLIFASLLLVSHPIGSTVRGYFYEVDHSKKIDSPSWINGAFSNSESDGKNLNDTGKSNSPMLQGGDSVINPQHNSGTTNLIKPDALNSGGINSITESQYDGMKDASNKDQITDFQDKDQSSSSQEVAVYSRGPPSGSKSKDMAAQKETAPSSTQEGQAPDNSMFTNGTKDVENAKPPPSSAVSNNYDIQSNPNNKRSTSSATSNFKPSLAPGKLNQANTVDSGCDLYHGKWVYDPTGPLYSNNSCPVLTQMQNCRGNGRPDTDYENWRWKPAQCDLPWFDAKKFLELMRGKTLAYVGDSVARNQMESMLCILWQVEIPKNRGNKRMQRYLFRSTSTTIIRIWSSWLVHQTSEPFHDAPDGVVKLHIDAPDEVFMEFLPSIDVIVLSSGHWFAKKSVYILNNEIVGGQLWWPDKSQPMKINNIEAFGISVETVITAIVTHPNFTGVGIVRSFSPDHYEGGTWNTGGSCTGKTRPASDNELVENGFTKIMHEKQVTGFKRGIEKKKNKSNITLMDITEAFQYRHDGHPGPYRSPDPHKITKRGPDGKPPPQDCLHWCMPGPVDTWNEMVYEIVRREFEGRQEFPS